MPGIISNRSPCPWIISGPRYPEDFTAPPLSSSFSGKGLVYLQRTTQMPRFFCCPLSLSPILSHLPCIFSSKPALGRWQSMQHFSYRGNLSLSLGTKCITKGGTPASWTGRLSRAGDELLLRGGFRAQFEQNPSAQGGKVWNQNFRLPSQFFFFQIVIIRRKMTERRGTQFTVMLTYLHCHLNYELLIIKQTAEVLVDSQAPKSLAEENYVPFWQPCSPQLHTAETSQGRLFKEKP